MEMSDYNCGIFPKCIFERRTYVKSQILSVLINQIERRNLPLKKIVSVDTSVVGF